MEFIKYKCPVCDKHFNKDDDIVVCPECGAPHHRECYEKKGHCFYENEHSKDFYFENIASDNDESENNNDNIIICNNCKAENPNETFYCYKCGSPLNEQDRKSNNTQQQNNQPFGNQNIPPFGVPFGQGQQQVNPFDPMAGLKSDEPIAENVAAGEMSKYIGKNTQYYLRVFNHIKKFNNSRFNFSAFLFSGMYFLYRKMILLGIIFSFILIGFTVAETYVQMMPEYREIYSTVLNAQSSGQIMYFSDIPGISTSDMLFLCLPVIFNVIKCVFMIISGLIANRSYYEHCTKKINKIKKISKAEETSKILETKGGVNLPLAVCVGVAYIAIIYIPFFIR